MTVRSLFVCDVASCSYWLYQFHFHFDIYALLVHNFSHLSCFVFCFHREGLSLQGTSLNFIFNAYCNMLKMYCAHLDCWWFAFNPFKAFLFNFWCYYKTYERVRSCTNVFVVKLENPDQTLQNFCFSLCPPSVCKRKVRFFEICLFSL